MEIPGSKCQETAVAKPGGWCFREAGERGRGVSELSFVLRREWSEDVNWGGAGCVDWELPPGS